MYNIIIIIICTRLFRRNNNTMIIYSDKISFLRTYIKLYVKRVWSFMILYYYINVLIQVRFQRYK
jgi:hypothetical protein